MRAFWGSFARTGVPVAGALEPAWQPLPPATAIAGMRSRGANAGAGRRTLLLGLPSRMSPTAELADACAFWANRTFPSP